jgi:hypothetical protein
MYEAYLAVSVVSCQFLDVDLCMNKGNNKITEL